MARLHSGTDEMEAAKQPGRSGRGHTGGPQPRVVAIKYRPTPDAEARLRRIAAILLDHATRAAAQTGDGDGQDGR
ncbi:MAG: hypothetical protein OXE43_07505 [Chloroflexi bacterium]|nr:hypothetical protein [Chloroflexota bacterium]